MLRLTSLRCSQARLARLRHAGMSASCRLSGQTGLVVLAPRFITFDARKYSGCALRVSLYGEDFFGADVC